MTSIMLIGDGWRTKETEEQVAFAGTNKWVLENILSQNGVSLRDCYTTCAFNEKLKRGKVESLCGTKAQGISGLPQVASGKYLLPEYKHHLDRLKEEIKSVSPDVIVTLGAGAAWAVTHQSGIKAIRGFTTKSALGPWKVVPTYHPSDVLAQWKLRPIVLADVGKAKRESESVELIRPEREIWIRPTLDDLRHYEEKYIAPATKLACDIETKQNQITCIGFSPSAETAIVIPFFEASGKNYWQTQAEEIAAWEYVRRWCKDKPTIFQNGLYDMTFLWTTYGIPVPAAADDTMLLHHAMQPEMEKGLAFLASIYTDEASWKYMNKGMAHD